MGEVEGLAYVSCSELKEELTEEENDANKMYLATEHTHNQSVEHCSVSKKQINEGLTRNHENHHLNKDINEKIDNYDGDELKIAIYQFLNGAEIDALKSDENNKISESNEFIKLTTDKETPYSCGVCGREFTAVGGLVIHLRVHTGDQPFSCTECSKAFSNRANLRKHMRIHNNIRPYECDICGAKFTLNQNMQSHRLTHSGEKRHSCTICGKSFSRAHHVKRHMDTHALSPEKNHECSICGKGFNRKENLHAHVKTHDKPVLGCVFCGQYFKGDGRLKCHVRKKHPDEHESFEISNNYHIKSESDKPDFKTNNI